MGFMDNRNGMDNLGRFLLIISMIFIVLSFLFGNIFFFIALALLIYSYFRAFSRNYIKRAQENQRFLSLTDSVVSRFKLRTKQLKDKDHKYYKCPRCKRTLRVPRKKGRIAICCPTCGTEFVKRT